MRRKPNVLSEVNMMMICYNLRRLVSIYGSEALKNKLKRLELCIFNQIASFLDHVRSFFHQENLIAFELSKIKPTRNVLY